MHLQVTLTRDAAIRFAIVSLRYVRPTQLLSSCCRCWSKSLPWPQFNMAIQAAPGREKIVAKLEKVQHALEQRQYEIDDYLYWVSTQPLRLPKTIRKRSAIADDLSYIEKTVDFFNFRTNFLRKRGSNMDDTSTLDAMTVLAQAMQPPLGTEMMHLTLKRAIVEAETMLRAIGCEIHEEEKYTYGLVCTLIGVMRLGILERERAPEFLEWMGMRKEREKLRDTFANELNADAVWLCEKKDRLEFLELRLRDEDVWFGSLGAHEMVMFELFADVAALGIEIGGRQRLIVEFCERV